MEPDSLSLRTATTKLKVIWHFAFGVLHSAFSILQNTSYRIEVIPKYLLEPNGPLSLPNVLACSFQSFLPINIAIGQYEADKLLKTSSDYTCTANLYLYLHPHL